MTLRRPRLVLATLVSGAALAAVAATHPVGCMLLRPLLDLTAACLK